MKKPVIISAGSAAAIAVGIFVSMAQAQAIFVPYLTPTRIEFQDLESEYPVNGIMNYSISLTGYGSNCIDFQAQVIREQDKERVAYFGEVQDCRKIEISQGPYNYTKSFVYSGSTVLGKAGNYEIQVNVRDQITDQRYAKTRSFVVEDSS
ncbi:MAG: hypothetical protein AB1351_11100 [Thermoproteota archaeon]